MGRIALVGVVLAAVTVPAGMAAHAPRWTAKGAITKLNKHAITVNGKSCEITTGSPKLGLRVFVLGSTVKIVCADGVLLTIDLLHRATGTPGQPGSTASASVTSSANGSSTSVSSSANGSSSSSASALAIAGDFSITAIGNGSISVKGSSSTFTCTIGAGSPDVSAFHVGGHVSKMTCKDDVLSTIAP